MGNQGTTNWKLTTFFAISLMLIAGLFSNAAIAGNGDGDNNGRMERMQLTLQLNLAMTIPAVALPAP